MGEICAGCGKSCGIPPYSEMPWGGILDDKDYCALCYVAKLVKEKRTKEIKEILGE